MSLTSDDYYSYYSVDTEDDLIYCLYIDYAGTVLVNNYDYDAETFNSSIAYYLDMEFSYGDIAEFVYSDLYYYQYNDYPYAYPED